MGSDHPLRAVAAAIDFKSVRRRGATLLRKQGQCLIDPEVILKADAASPRSPYRGDPEREHRDNSSNSRTDRSPLPQIAQRQHALKTRPHLPPAVDLAGQTLIVGDRKPPATNRLESVPPGETQSWLPAALIN